MVEANLTAAEAATHEIEAIVARTAPAVQHFVPVDFRARAPHLGMATQRDIVDATCVAGEASGRSYEELKQAEAIVTTQWGGLRSRQANLEARNAETWSGGPVNLLTLAALAEIAFHYENGATTPL